MKTVVILFNTSCIFEIVILNYFLKYRDKEVLFVSKDDESINATEGYSINVDSALSDVDVSDVELVIIPGGDTTEIVTSEVCSFLNEVNKQGGMIAAICAGVDVLESAGLLDNTDSTKKSNSAVVVDNNIITASANGYVDFAIEVAKKMSLFESEEDLQETIAFWKEYKSQ